jgi:hypothetical protein
MGRWLLVALLGAGLITGAYFWLRTPPAFDLDTFGQMVSRLRAGYGIARKVADIDAIPDWLKLDAAHGRSIQSILQGHTDDCPATAALLRERHARYQTEQAALPDRMTPERLDSLTPAERNQVAHKTIYVLAPVYLDLEPIVGQWAWECKPESEILTTILGTQHY